MADEAPKLATAPRGGAQHPSGGRAGAAPLLEVQGLTCGYGEAVVLSDVSFTMAPGRSLALLGRNGTGKTTLIDTLVGVTRRHAGTIRLAGQEIHALPVHERAAAGIGWVPQERNIFKSLTVAENLSAVARPGPWTEARVFDLFPRLAERKKNLGNQLSGGEQQMLAFGRALVLNPKLLLLDEPLEGLAPIIVEELLRAIRRVAREEGLSSIVVEQHPQMVLGVTDDAIVLDRGGIAYRATSEALLDDPAPLDAWLGVAHH
jgi:branched-chain amino acid transport system ATP-binding protein